MANTNQTIGFIGLGLMGKPMARHLHQSGHRLIIHNRSRDVIDELTAEGMEPASSPAEVAEKVGAGTIFLMLSNTPATEEVISTKNPNGLFTKLQKGTLIIDMGSNGIFETRQWHQQATALEADWLDAPVSGGQKGATEASLTIMAGGTPSAFQRALPLLQILGTKITHMGDTSAGQVTKLANQILVALTISAVSEAFTLCKSLGVDLAKAREALLGGFAQSTILNQHGQRMIEENFQPGGRASMQLKDVLEACRIAEKQGLDLPMLTKNRQLWEKMIEEGLGELDHSGLYQWYQNHQSPNS